MAGYAARTRPSEGVLQDIWAKALALQDEGGATSVIVTMDLVGIPKIVAEEIAGRARDRFGLSRDRLQLSTSHTHSGPIVGRRRRPSYRTTEAQDAVIARYTDALVDKVTNVIGESIKALAPATLAFEQGFAGIAVNRRRAVMSRSLPGPVDHDVPVLAVRGGDGKLRAIVFGYACHATVLADYVINGDWPGFAQAAIEAEHPGATAMFVAGCGADANPLPRRSVDLARKYGEIMAAAVGDVVQAKMKPVTGRLRTSFELVDAPLQKPPTREEWQARAESGPENQRRYAKSILATLESEGNLIDRYPYPVQVWKFGDAFTYIVLGGEAVVDYALRFKARYGADRTWVAAYSNDVFAYIPSRRVLEEGGYEGGGAMTGSALPAPFAPAVEEVIAGKVDELVKRVTLGATESGDGH